MLFWLDDSLSSDFHTQNAHYNLSKVKGLITRVNSVDVGLVTCLFIRVVLQLTCLRDLRRGSSTARLLVLRVQIPPEGGVVG